MTCHYAIAKNAHGFRRIYDMADGDLENFPIATCKLEGEDDPNRRYGIYSAEALLNDIEVYKALIVTMVDEKTAKYIEETRKELGE